MHIVTVQVILTVARFGRSELRKSFTAEDAESAEVK